MPWLPAAAQPPAVAVEGMLSPKMTCGFKKMPPCTVKAMSSAPQRPPGASPEKYGILNNHRCAESQNGDILGAFPIRWGTLVNLTSQAQKRRQTIVQMAIHFWGSYDTLLHREAGCLTSTAMAGLCSTSEGSTDGSNPQLCTTDGRSSNSFSTCKNSHTAT